MALDSPGTKVPTSPKGERSAEDVTVLFNATLIVPQDDRLVVITLARAGGSGCIRWSFVERMDPKTASLPIKAG